MSYTTLDCVNYKARKRHRCSWCSEHIEPGDTYHKTVGIVDGHFSVTKMHPECEDALLEVLKEFPSGACVGWDMRQPRGGSGDGIYEW